MTDFQWRSFCRFRDEYRERVAFWLSAVGAELVPLQKEAADADKTPSYPVETPVVYNRSFDDVAQSADIKLLVIGDNPGKDEQREKNRRYLVGQAGKLADGFFRRNPELGVDFRKNVVIFNKTPLHTAKTKQLAYVLKNGGEKIRRVFAESQSWCAEHTARLHRELNAETLSKKNQQESPVSGCGLWLVGYGELGPKGLFSVYRDGLAAAYAGLPEKDPAKNSLLVFQHFSMNRFAIDLRQFTEKRAAAGESPLPLAENLQELGVLHRRAILGF